jgi:hypothetical protein
MKNKLKLSDLKVQSFVTELEKKETETVKGGVRTETPVCFSAVPACVNSNAPHCLGSIVDACPTVFCTP